MDEAPSADRSLWRTIMPAMSFGTEWGPVCGWVSGLVCAVGRTTPTSDMKLSDMGHRVFGSGFWFWSLIAVGLADCGDFVDFGGGVDGVGEVAEEFVGVLLFAEDAFEDVGVVFEA